MTDEQKVTTVQTLCEHDVNATADVVLVYLHLAASKMIERIYPYDLDKTEADIPARYDMIQCELASRLFLRQGAQGENSHDENGVNRTYDSVDDFDILSRLTPFVKVVG